jgi:hypothetical protein
MVLAWGEEEARNKVAGTDVLGPRRETYFRDSKIWHNVVDHKLLWHRIRLHYSKLTLT